MKLCAMGLNERVNQCKFEYKLDDRGEQLCRKKQRESNDIENSRCKREMLWYQYGDYDDEKIEAGRPV